MIAMLTSDVEESKKLMADDMVFINHLGKFISKDDDIAAVERGDVTLSTIKVLSRDIRVAGDIAVVISDSEIDVTIENDKLSDRLIYTRIWQKIDDEWKLVRGQATRVV